MKFEMDSETEIISPGSSSNPNSSYGYHQNINQSQSSQRRQPRTQRHHHHHQQQQSSTKWSQEENKMFENALAVYDKDSPDRWEKVAAMIPGRTVSDVMKQYEELEADVSSIEAGLVPDPGYTYPPAFTLDWVSGNGNSSNHQSFYDGFSQSDGFGLGFHGGKRLASVRGGCDQERKKGVPWTEEEHKLFLLGLKKYGKGDWRNISRNFVITRTPTQVASHAQKYFIRQLSGGKDKRRASIHDITTVNFNESLSHTVSPDHLARGHDSPEMHFQWSQSSNGGSMDFNAAYGVGSNMVSQSQGMSSFQMQSGMHYPQPQV